MLDLGGPLGIAVQPLPKNPSPHGDTKMWKGSGLCEMEVELVGRESCSWE